MNEEFTNFVLNEIINKYEDEKMLLVGVNPNLYENGKRIAILAVVEIMPIVLSDLFVGTLYAFDTTTHKPTYITFEVVGDSTNHLQIPTFKAYQDGADITATYLTKVYGIEFYLL